MKLKSYLHFLDFGVIYKVKEWVSASVLETVFDVSLMSWGGFQTAFLLLMTCTINALVML